MGGGSGGQGACPPWIFIHGTDIVHRFLIVLFFGIFTIFWSFFSAPPPSLENFLLTPLVMYYLNQWGSSTKCFLQDTLKRDA